MWVCENNYSEGDDTVTFATKKEIVTEYGIKELLTLCSFYNASQDCKKPSITVAKCDSEMLCLAMDNAIYLFEDQSFSQLLFSIRVESEVDCCCLMEKANVMLVGLRKGDVCCFNLQGHRLFKRCVPVANCSGSDTFVNFIVEDKLMGIRNGHSVLIIGHLGSIHRIAWQDTPDLNVQYDVTISCLQEEKLDTKVYASILMPFKDMTIALVGEQVTLWSGSAVDSCNLFDTDLKPFVKAQLWKNKYLVCLTRNSKLLVFCVETWLCCVVWEKIQVEDFSILQDERDSHKENIIMVAKNVSSSEGRSIIFSSLPDFKFAFCVQKSELLYLIPTSKNIICIEGYPTRKHVEKVIISALVDNNLEQRLQHLLIQHKYDEAESLASQFGLDVQLVLKEKAMYYMTTLSSINDPSVFKQLICTLNRIMDSHFIASLCVNHYMYHINDMKNLLYYVLNRLHESVVKGHVPSDLDTTQLELYSRLQKLKTFTFIKGNVPQNSMNVKSIFTLDWLKTCFACLSNGEMRKARFIWLQHLKDGPVLLRDEMELLVVSVSPCVKHSEILGWLHLIIPYILYHTPDVVENVAKWAVKRASLTESDKDQWPHNAIVFIEDFLSLLIKTQESEEEKSFCSLGRQIEFLQSFLSSLRELTVLKDRYTIYVPLELFLKENKLEVAWNILKKVTHDDVDKILREDMKSFVEKHDLLMDSVVLYFIKQQLSVVGEYCSATPNNLWEPIIVTYIKHVTSVEDRMECILCALKCASIPWSDTMMKLAAECHGINHIRSTEIRRLEKFIEIKLVFKKYNIEMDLLLNSRHAVRVFLMRRIIHEARNEMVKDALTIADDSLKLRVEAYTLCVHKFISRKEYNEAQCILEAVDPEIFVMCCERLLCRIEVETDLIVLYSYIDFIYSFSHKLVNIASVRDNLENIINLHILKLNFGFTITLQDYRNIDKRLCVFKSWIQLLLTKATENNSEISSVCKKANFLAKLCGFPAGDGTLEIFKIAPRNQITDVVNTEFSPHSRENMSSISKQIITSITGTCLNASLQCRIMTNFILDHYVCVNEPWVQIFSWINRARDISRTSLSKKTDLMKGCQMLKVLHDRSNGVWKPEVLQFLHTLFSFMEHTESHLEVNVHDVIQHLQNLVDVLLQENIFIILIAMLNITRSCLYTKNIENNDIIDTFMKQVLEKLISEMLSSQNFDINFAAGILFSFDTATAKCWLNKSEKEFRTVFKKLERIAKLGILFSKHNKSDELIHYKYLYSECLWARYLHKQEINSDKLLIQEKSKIVMQLVLQNEMIKAEVFCKTFDIDFQIHLPMCLENVILSWEPQFEVKVNTEGKSIISVKNNEDDSVERCIVIAERMKKNDVKNCLENIHKKINYYYYEMYVCVDILKKRILQESSPCRILLFYLRNYQRTRPVQKEERETWSQLYPNSLNYPPIAEWRLPFWPNDMWRVILPELTLDTYKQWLQMSDTFNVTADIIRTIVLKQTATLLSEPVSTDTDWCKTPVDEKVVSQIKKCASEMACEEKACAALYHVFRNTRRGAAKVQLAKLCYDFSYKWAKSVNTDSAKEVLENINKMYIEFSTINVLYMHNLGKPCYVSKVSNLELLITELYHHPDIVKKSLCLESNCPDINNAVTEIEKVHGSMILNDLLLKLLEEWLTPVDAMRDKFDDTVTMRGTFQALKNSKQKEKENFMRASYLLKRNHSNKLLSSLSEIVFGNDKEEYIKFKYNAMICIMNSFSMEKLSTFFGKSPESICQHLHILQFISDLDSLGFVMTVAQFENCEKSHLVTELMSKGEQNNFVLPLAAHLAIKYRIFDAEIWKQLLKYMIKWSPPEDFEDVLGKLPVTTPGLIEAWSHILFFPFRSCNIPLSDDQSKSCLHSLELLQRCPVSNGIDLLQLGQICCQLNFPQWAALILPFMYGESLETLRKNILSQCSSNEIISKLEDSEDDFVLVSIRAILEEEKTERFLYNTLL